jgi:hypothetical protein
MKATAFIFSLIVLAGFAPSIASPRHPSADFSIEPMEPEITVYVSETCSMAPVVEQTARRTAASLFDSIGVRLRFTTVRPERPDPGMITLHIRNQAPKNVALLTVGAANIDPGHADAFVFCDRIAVFYRTIHDKELGTLMGYAIAHELGHVLLAAPGHSPDGVMKACWTRNDIVPMLQHAIGFSTADAERIHAVQASRRAVALASAGTNRRAPAR